MDIDKTFLKGVHLFNNADYNTAHICWEEILQKGNKHKKTKPILKAPKKRGFIDAFKPNLPKGYALPRKNITKTIKLVCFGDNILPY